MARRYVPKTYNNRRFLRIITTGVIIIAISFVILFLVIFFTLQAYVVEGQLQIPWLSEEELYPDEYIEPNESDESGEYTQPNESDEPNEIE